MSEPALTTATLAAPAPPREIGVGMFPPPRSIVSETAPALVIETLWTLEIVRDSVVPSIVSCRSVPEMATTTTCWVLSSEWIHAVGAGGSTVVVVVGGGSVEVIVVPVPPVPVLVVVPVPAVLVVVSVAGEVVVGSVGDVDVPAGFVCGPCEIGGAGEVSA
jgi:hypothetical protein